MKTRLLFLFLLAFSFANSQVTVSNVTTVTGSTQGDAIGDAATARFWGPYGIANNANYAVTDTRNNKIKYIYSDDSTVLLAGSSTAGFVNGTGAAARFSNPTGIARLRFNDFVVCDTGNNAIRRVNIGFPLGVTTTIAGSSGVAGFLDGDVSVAQFNQPYGIAVNVANDDIYIADTFNYKIRKISGTTVSTFAGSTQGFADGTGTAAQFNLILGLVVDSNGNVFVIDGPRIRRITPAGVVTTFAGGATAGYLDGTGTAAQFGNGSNGITIDASNNLYIADVNNYRIRRITPAGVVTTIAGDGNIGTTDGVGTSASFSTMSGIAIRLGTTTLAVVDFGNNRIRRVTQTIVNVPTISAISTTAITATGATINYSLNANGGATTSIVRFGTASGGLSNQVAGFAASGNSVTPGNAPITGLLAGRQYFYRIEATNAAGTSTSTERNFTTAPDPTPPPADALIAEYNFNNTYSNINGGGTFGFTAGMSLVTGRDGVTANGALNIFNSGAIASIPNLPYGSSSRTVSLWAKTNTMNNPYNMIFSYGQGSNSNSFGSSYNATVCELFGYANNISVNSASVNNTWYHFVYVYDGTNAKIYKNGVLLITVGKIWNTINNGSTFKLGIGVGNEYNFDGTIDDLKIYNYAITDADVSSLFTNNTLSSADFNQNNLQVSLYPNPATDVLNIEMANEINSIEIYNIQGQKVRTANQKQINISDLAAGLYMVRIQDNDNGIATKKFVKK